MIVASQALGVAFTRDVLKLPPVVAMTADQLVAEIGPTIPRYLTSRPCALQ
jgi:hypothetical protein